MDIYLWRWSVLISVFILLKDFIHYSLFGWDILTHDAFTKSGLIWFTLFFDEIIASIIPFIFSAYQRFTQCIVKFSRFRVLEMNNILTELRVLYPKRL